MQITFLFLRKKGGKVAWGGVEPPFSPYQSDVLPLHHQAFLTFVFINRDDWNRTSLLVFPKHAGARSPSSRFVSSFKLTRAGFEPASPP